MITESHSPYFLYPSKGPGMMITVVIFDGTNYDLWQRDVRKALKAKNKLCFIDGSLPRPEPKKGEELSEADAWDMANSILCSWLLNIIDPKLHMSIGYSDIANIMWDDMKKRYAMANAPKIHQLKANIANCKQGDLDSWMLVIFTQSW